VEQSHKFESIGNFQPAGEYTPQRRISFKSENSSPNPLHQGHLQLPHSRNIGRHLPGIRKTQKVCFETDFLLS
jgi:hypothetical protein